VRSKHVRRVSAIVNGQRTSFSPGDPQKLDLGDRACTIDLMKVGNPVLFIVTCSKK
jgi:hypothetical protein